MQSILVIKGVPTPIHINDLRFPKVKMPDPVPDLVPEVKPFVFPSQISISGHMEVEFSEGGLEKLKELIEEAEEKDLLETIESFSPEEAPEEAPVEQETVEETQEEVQAEEAPEDTRFNKKKHQRR